jgi:hypothetical protein
MNDQQLLDALQAKIKERAPNFEILFKDQNGFMKFLGILMFFNKGFMTKFITTIKEKVYWTSKKSFEECPLRSFLTLSHEYVHIMDYVAHPVRFVLGYLFPQILAVFSLFAVFAFISPWFLLFLLFLLVLTPSPAPFRKKYEMRGFGMGLKLYSWLWGSVSEGQINKCVDHFTTSEYYYMWPFENCVKKELTRWADPNDLSCLKDSNPAYKDVYHIIKE